MIKFKSAEAKKAGEVNLTPMIDIIFNLLIFFLITAVVSQKGLNLKLPETSTAEKRPPKSLEITVTEEKKILFDGEEVKKEDVEKKLTAQKSMAEGEKAENITLKADTKAPFGLFIFVMDTARKVGLKNLVIATEVKKESVEEKSGEQ